MKILVNDCVKTRHLEEINVRIILEGKICKKNL